MANQLKNIELSNKELEILKFVFQKTPLRIYNECVNAYQTQMIYDRKAVIIVNEFFEGKTLRYSVFMRNLFNKFITTNQEVRAKDINLKLKDLSKSVKIAKRLKRFEEYSSLAKKYNNLISEHNECTNGLNTMKKYYKKFKK